jgi:transcriptional regulator GlxA family with amidase domain
LRTTNSIDVVAPVELFAKILLLWRQLNKGKSSRPLFRVLTVAENRKPVTLTNGVTLRPDATLGGVKADLIVVPSINDRFGLALKKNRSYVDWVRESFKGGVHVSSLCTGAFVVGASGILDGKRATTHWLFADEFRRRFPRVTLQERHMIVDEGDIVTCGGATTFLNLVIYLIDKYFDHDLAVLASKMFLIDMDRPSQLPFKGHLSSPPHGDHAIARIHAFLAEHLQDELKIDAVAKKAGMSVRNFSRRFKTATGEAFSTHVQKLRIENAKRLLEGTTFSASEIMYRVGYNDDRSFRRLFKEYTSVTPKHYRNKFRITIDQVRVGSENLPQRPGRRRS